MNAVERRGAQPSRKSGRRRRVPKWLTVVMPERPAFMLVRMIRFGLGRETWRVDSCTAEGGCTPVMNFRTGKEARIFAFERARRLDVEVRT